MEGGEIPGQQSSPPIHNNLFSLALPHIFDSNERVQKQICRLQQSDRNGKRKRLLKFINQREGKLPPEAVKRVLNERKDPPHERWIQLHRQAFQKRWLSQLAAMRKPLRRIEALAGGEGLDGQFSTSTTPATSPIKKRTGKKAPTASAIKKSKKEDAPPTHNKKKLKLINTATEDSITSDNAISTAGLPEDEARRLLWSHIARKQVPRLSRAIHATTNTRLTNAKRIATAAVTLVKRQYTRLSGARPVTAARRAMKEMLSFWRKNEREERDLRKRAEKEAQERRRVEEEEREARRQAKKLNFLITQTELYSHFVGKKGASVNASVGIAKGTDFADVNDDDLKAEAERLASNAAAAHQARLAQFDSGKPTPSSDDMDFMNPTTLKDAAILDQPSLLQVQLKSYQLKGLTWLASLYEQGINGILADEMGLGKTVQSISLLAHLAERQNNWGPFLIVTPASTLHNWQQEFTRFLPALKVIPYWGSVQDRKVLRSTCMPYWTSGKKQVTRDTPFHVMITSYQLIVSDEAFLQKVKWQYMILDEAQAIKSSQSIRWKTLLGFNCRNRLLLTGTPIQNSMQELWALLHFIMPTLFDSHDEFSEWFSKDIESHAENRGSGLNAHQVQRLHMILKPFMLRRIKRDVQNELGDKVERNVLCELSPRQKRLYRGLRDKLPALELLMRGSGESALMNLVMQFRKVCNHPELLERTETSSPLTFTTPERLIHSNLNNSLIRPHPGVIRFLPPRLVIEERVNPLSRQLMLDLHDEWTDCRIDGREEEELFSIDLSRSLQYLRDRIPTAAPIKVLARSFEVVEDVESIEAVGAVKDASIINQISLINPSLHNSISIPSMEKFIRDCGKLSKLDELLVQLKTGDHRCLIYNQMTKMIDLLEEYLQFRGYSYLRLDGSTNIGMRRDLVNAWQGDPSIFVFLLSTRAGGLGINLTAADTVIFYDSDWNPTVDQQAMDRAHRLGQLKQVTVYRMITKGTIEERIQQRAKQKDEIHKVVIAGGSFSAADEGASEGGDKRELMSLLMEED